VTSRRQEACLSLLFNKTLRVQQDGLQLQESSIWMEKSKKLEISSTRLAMNFHSMKIFGLKLLNCVLLRRSKHC